MSDEKLIYEDLDAESNKQLLALFTSSFQSGSGYIKCKGSVMPEHFKEFGDRIRQMEIRDDDIWVCSYPKAGTTWTQEMVWCIGNDLNFEGAKEEIHTRFPYLELSAVFDSRKKIAENPDLFLPEFLSDSMGYIEKLSSRRFIKTHLPFNLLPEKLQNGKTGAKIIYVVRNPRDTVISFYHHSKLLKGYNGSFEQFSDLFLTGKLNYGIFFNHLKGYWQQKSNPNILILKYEDMKKDLKSAIYKTADFIGKTLSEDDVQKLLDHLSFSKMKQNRAVNNEYAIELYKKYNSVHEEGSFIRSGETGQWKEIMDYDMCKRFEKWEEQHLKEIDNFTF